MKDYRIDIGNSRSILKLMNEPIRSKQQLDLLLLESLRVFIIGNIEESNSPGKIVLHIDRMNRFIYKTENKIFSIGCPFAYVKIDDNYVFKDTSLGIELDSKLISSMIAIIRKENIIGSFEEMLEEILDMTEYEETKLIWDILKRLYYFEYGYIRYDYDKEGENGKLHPLNHLDINFMNSSQFKIGLDKEISIEEFIDILDITTECHYLLKK